MQVYIHRLGNFLSSTASVSTHIHARQTCKCNVKYLLYTHTWYHTYICGWVRIPYSSSSSTTTICLQFILLLCTTTTAAAVVESEGNHTTNGQSGVEICRRKQSSIIVLLYMITTCTQRLRPQVHYYCDRYHLAASIVRTYIPHICTYNIWSIHPTYRAHSGPTLLYVARPSLDIHFLVAYYILHTYTSYIIATTELP